MKYFYILLMLISFGCSKKTIATKSPTPYQELQQYLKLADEKPEDFLFVLDGIILSDFNQLKELDSEKIEVVEKISDAAAKTIYGEKAKPYSVIINTKSQTK